MSARDRLAGLVSAEALELLEAFVDERVAEALAAAAPVPANGVPPWLTLEQAAERLGCSPDAVRMRVQRGRLEHRRQGKAAHPPPGPRGTSSRAALEL